MARIYKKKFGEVLTPGPLVCEILDKLPRKVWKKRKTFLDNSCGNGNFLVEVLRYKIAHGHKPRKCLSTIYGVDIAEDNVQECRKRLLEIANSTRGLRKPLPHSKLRSVIRLRNKETVNKNIVCADAFTYDYSFK